ncbi:MAG: transposase [Candidatus Marinimicrobia bacterium]|nr:transposase [Candidatus Neomarinimicrobiota bacterium]
MESKAGIIQRIADMLPDRRHPGYVQHSFRQLLTQRVFQIAAGYEDANDCDYLKDDPVLKIACHRLEGSLASQPIRQLPDFENGFSRTDFYRIAQAFLDAFIASYTNPPKAILLDLDDTDDPTHGSQQMALFNRNYNSYCYLPLHKAPRVHEESGYSLITSSKILIAWTGNPISQ